jgi:SHS2 domain-containing protein
MGGTGDRPSRLPLGWLREENRGLVYRWLEHTSEIELLIEDESPGAVLTESLVALGDALAEARGGEAVTHEMRIRAQDLPGLLAAWIQELVNLAEADGFIPERVVRMELEGTDVEAIVGGERSVPQSRIKEVTHRRTEMKQAGGAWWARVVLALE